MFIYLSKKIAIPNNTKLNCLAWNKDEGFIAVGGDDGLLKVLKLDGVGGGDNEVRTKGLANSSNLSMNQSLEGHTENIQVITWNESHRKLTTSDRNGVIIVWMMYKGAWYEEMINNRKKSTVVGMAWNSDGMKICIIYEDGAIIVGSVDGNRIWAKELKSVALSGVQWSPDGKLLLFSLQNGEIHLYDNQGNFTMRIEIQCIDNINQPVSVVGLDWYNGRHGYMHAFCPRLAICYENGRVQLMCNESDPNPVIIDTGMQAVCSHWNHNGTLLAIAGRLHEDTRECNIVQFYSPFGDHMRTLKVPGKTISSCTWEGGSLRLALAVDSYVYFANIRPDYKWCYFKKTIVYTTCRPQKAGVSVSFWDITNNQCHTMYVPVLLAVAGFGDYCVIATTNLKSETRNGPGDYGLLLCNALPTIIDRKYMDMKPNWVTMNSSHVFAASKNNFVVWHYHTPKTSSASAPAGKFRIFHIDDNPSGAVEVIQDLEAAIDETTSTHPSNDPICALVASDRALLIARESGTIQHYALPHVALINRYRITSRPHKLAINSNSTRLSVIDTSGLLTLVELSESVARSSSTETTKLERRDVWAMCWASDNPQLLAIMEKTRMYVFKGLYPEEPMATSGYICSFQDLEIQAVLLDEVMEQPERPTKDHLLKLEVKSLRDTRQLLEKVGINEAAQFIEDNPHPRLWRLLAEAAIMKMNFQQAEAAFIRSLDYAGIQLIKKLQGISNEQLKKAAVAAYFKNFDDAEKLYLESDRRDLALTLRETLGDWFRVIQILKMGLRGKDMELEMAYNNVGDYFANRANWAAAIEYYEKAQNREQMIKCYYFLEDYSNLEGIIDLLTENNPLLRKIGDLFASIAVCSSAVKAYVKLGDVKTAVDVCVRFNEWDQAVQLAKEYNMAEISDLLSKYARHMLENNRIWDAIELYNKAKFYLDAGKLALRIAEKKAKTEKNPLQVKKYYVYAALLVEKYINQPPSEKVRETISDLDIIENSWHGAVAWHLIILMHKHLRNGRKHDAMIVALKLREYESVVPVAKIYGLLALCSSLDKSFEICSKAFMRLGAIGQLSKVEQDEYSKLAFDLFSAYNPTNLRENSFDCPNCDCTIFDWTTKCKYCMAVFPTCMGTGRPLSRESTIWNCNVCKQFTEDTEMALNKTCPLCHSPVST